MSTFDNVIVNAITFSLPITVFDLASGNSESLGAIYTRVSGLVGQLGFGVRELALCAICAK